MFYLPITEIPRYQNLENRECLNIELLFEDLLLVRRLIIATDFVKLKYLRTLQEIILFNSRSPNAKRIKSKSLKIMKLTE